MKQQAYILLESQSLLTYLYTIKKGIYYHNFIQSTCENNTCTAERQVAVQNGLPNYECTHTRLISNDCPSGRYELNKDTLQSMVTGNLLNQEVVTRIERLIEASIQTSCPLIAVWPYARDNWQVLSIFTNKRSHWCLYRRVRVMCTIRPFQISMF